MSDTTNTDDSTETLTLRARGPAVVERAHETSALDVTESEDVDLSATIDVDAEWIEAHGGVYKQGARLKASAVTTLIADRLSEGDAEYYADGAEWEFTLSGSLDDWGTVAVRLAKNRGSATWSNDTLATTACHILDGLAEYAPDDRPRLAMLDLIQGYDVDDYTREGVLAELSEDGGGVGVEEVAADA